MKRFALLVLVLLPACRPATPPPQTAAAAPATPATQASPALPGALHWFRSSAEYRAATIQTYRLAAQRLAEIARDLQPGTWAVSLDADETVLDNSQYQKELAETGAHFEGATWNAWVTREAAPAIPGAAGFLEAVHRLGGKIAIVTNRGEGEACDATRNNLRKVGLAYDVVLCQPKGANGEKEPRWERVTRGTASPDLPPLQLVLWVGDNIQDFPDLDQAVRTRPGAFGDFGVRYFVIPNPMYGSWEKNPQE